MNNTLFKAKEEKGLNGKKLCGIMQSNLIKLLHRIKDYEFQNLFFFFKKKV